jgi:hypothetical protein
LVSPAAAVRRPTLHRCKKQEPRRAVYTGGPSGANTIGTQVPDHTARPERDLSQHEPVTYSMVEQVF